jgi:uncharacterized protein YdhG (YjbR/CyaY superfamily)
MTKREMLNKIAAVCADDTEIVNFCNHEIELLNKKSSTKTPTKNQIENEHFKEIIFNYLQRENKPLTIRNIIENNTELATLSSQRISPILKTLEKNGLIVHSVVKKVNYYGIV